MSDVMNSRHRVQHDIWDKLFTPDVIPFREEDELVLNEHETGKVTVTMLASVSKKTPAS